jgi:hypothetical protein
MKLLEHVQKHTVTTNPVTTSPVLPTFSAGLIQHIIATNQHLPEIAATSMYEYVYATFDIVLLVCDFVNKR